MEVRRNLSERLRKRLKEADRDEESIPDGLIYHYTTAKGLEGIIRTQEIHATHTDYLNDLSEVQYGRHIVATILDHKHPHWSNGEKSLMPMVGQEPDPVKFLDQFPADKRSVWALLFGIRTYILNHRDHNIYVASFCESDDMLSQWRGYGNRGGGYSIGFKVNKSIIKTGIGDNQYGLFKVIYDRMALTEPQSFWSVQG